MDFEILEKANLALEFYMDIKYMEYYYNGNEKL